MNRSNYFNYIEEKLSILATRIEMRGKLNILDYHLHSENFYACLLNKLCNWQLENTNTFKPNTEAIDLIDKDNKIIIQVSATVSKEKIDSTLSKNLLPYTGYTFKFISISKKANTLQDKEFSNLYNLTFDPKSDILDITSILNIIKALNIDDLKSIYELIKKELGEEISPQKIETNLAEIINILSKEDWDHSDSHLEISLYEIERKIERNNLNAAKVIIDDYKIHYGRIDKIYSEFNKIGSNKSSSVLASIRKFYLINMNTLTDDQLFFRITECVIDRIQESLNHNGIPYDELELCVNILVVDAFIRCKIFKNPEKYSYATS